MLVSTALYVKQEKPSGQLGAPSLQVNPSWQQFAPRKAPSATHQPLLATELPVPPAPPAPPAAPASPDPVVAAGAGRLAQTKRSAVEFNTAQSWLLAQGSNEQTLASRPTSTQAPMRQS